MIASLINNANKGIIKANSFLFKYAPPNRAIAEIGVKLGRCGISLNIAPKKIKVEIKMSPGDRENLFI